MSAILPQLPRQLPKTQADWERFLNIMQAWQSNVLLNSSLLAGFGTPTGAAVVNNFPGASATLVQTSQTVAQLLLVLQQAGLVSI